MTKMIAVRSSRGIVDQRKQSVSCSLGAGNILAACYENKVSFNMGMRLNLVRRAVGNTVSERKSRHGPSKLQPAIKVVVTKYV